MAEQNTNHFVVRTDDLRKDLKMGEVVVHAVRGVTMSVARGELLGIIGPSGSGKSTLLGLIGGLDTPTAGRIWIDGQDITDLDERSLTRVRNEKIGFVFQFFNLIPTLTALENVALPVQFARGRKFNPHKRARELLNMLGLGDRIGRHLVVGLEPLDVHEVGGDRRERRVERGDGVVEDRAGRHDHLDAPVGLAEGVLGGPGGRHRRGALAGVDVLLARGDEALGRLEQTRGLLDVVVEARQRLPRVGGGQSGELLPGDGQALLDLLDAGAQRGEELRVIGLQVAQPRELLLLRPVHLTPVHSLGPDAGAPGSSSPTAPRAERLRRARSRLGGRRRTEPGGLLTIIC